MKIFLLFLISFILSFLSFVASEPSIWGLKVNGNKILNKDGVTMKFQGVSRSGTEFNCVHGYGIFDGPSDINSLKVIKSWNVSIIRIPLNEDCWLGINGVNPKYSGYNYQSAIINFVNSINSLNMAVILDLHWTAPGSTLAIGQQPMPDVDHSIDFWKSVANTFKNNSAAIFDVFNEPYPDSNSDTTSGWVCWKNGGSCPGFSYQAAGMQSLVSAIRSTGATNICMLGGLQYSNSLTHWLNYKPSDPLGNLAASWHSYNFNLCNNQNCWDSYIAPVAAQVPLIIGEFGENDCNTWYVNNLMNWADKRGISYSAWTWNTWDCKGGPSLISNYDGTATTYGAGVKAHYTDY